MDLDYEKMDLHSEEKVLHSEEMDIRSIEIAEFDYPLPDERIARHPLADRDRCRLLVRFADGSLDDRCFGDIVDLLPADSMLIYNNTRVINARLRFRKPSGALIEVFCLEPEAPRDYAQSFASTSACSWTCFVGNSKRWKEGELTLEVVINGCMIVLRAVKTQKRDNGSTIEFSWDDPSVTFSQIIEAAGEIPIPPYLNRRTEQSDSNDYQTVFSRIEGSVAAPTAGLHFTPALLDEVDRRGIVRREVTLHVGAGTFQPVKSNQIGDHPMHSEFISVSRELIEEMALTDRPVIAVGTTSVRTLESLYHFGCLAAQGRALDEVGQWYPYSAGHPRLSKRQALSALASALSARNEDRFVASTRIMIAPGYEFKVVDGIITNFHQPQSTLLLLVSAFTVGDWRRLYDHALADTGYRFLSYGDACLLLK